MLRDRLFSLYPQWDTVMGNLMGNSVNDMCGDWIAFFYFLFGRSSWIVFHYFGEGGFLVPLFNVPLFLL